MPAKAIRENMIRKMSQMEMKTTKDPKNQMKSPATNILRDRMVSRMANTVMMKRAMIENKEGRAGKRNRGRRN